MAAFGLEDFARAFQSGGTIGGSGPTFLASSAILFEDVYGFDPNAVGEYSFAIRSTVVVEEVAINVNLTAVPVPAVALFLLIGIGGLAVARRRRVRV